MMVKEGKMVWTVYTDKQLWLSKYLYIEGLKPSFPSSQFSHSSGANGGGFGDDCGPL